MPQMNEAKYGIYDSASVIGGNNNLASGGNKLVLTSDINDKYKDVGDDGERDVGDSTRCGVGGSSDSMLHDSIVVDGEEGGKCLPTILQMLAVNDDEYDDDEYNDDEYDDDNDSQVSVEANFNFEESDHEGDINDVSCLVMKNPEDSEEKSRIIIDNTFRRLAKENKGPYCNGSPEDIERNKKLDIILVKIAEPADKYIANHCTNDGNDSLKYRCRAMQGTESKKPGVYRGKCKNDRYKTG